MIAMQKIYGYDIVKVLGYGAHSTVYHVQDRAGEAYALKRTVTTSESSKGAIQQAITEHNVASQFSHAALRRSFKLLKPFGFGRPSEVSTLMELINGSPLSDLSNSPLDQIFFWSRHVAEALCEMHRLGFVHADIKPANIMIGEDGSVKLIDFGQTCRIGVIKPRVQGTPDFMAPEQTDRHRITPQTDIFNFGATLYFILTGRSLTTTGASFGRPGTRKEETIPPHHANASIPPAMSVLVMECVRDVPSDRPASMKDVVRRLAFIDRLASRKYVRPPSHVGQP